MANAEAREAQHGQKMIELKVRFWTNNIADEKGEILPKRAWTSGVVRVSPNKSHGISAGGKPVPFNSLMQITSAIEKLLVQEGITLHPGRMKRYIKPKGE